LNTFAIAAIAAAGSYLAGSVPFSFIAGKLLRGVDLREHGSGNLGASNTFRILGAVPGAVVLLLDIAKGFVPVLAAGAVADRFGLPRHWVVLLCALAAVLGHMFSIYLRFGGGKGIATSAGAFLAITPWATLGSCVVFAVVFGSRRIMSLATLSGAVTLPLFVYLADRLGLSPSHWSYLAVTVVLVLVIIYKHRANIRRLIAGTEPVLARKKHV
jgi:glycerol-3-phosphate acyltransferase PlsY